MNLTIISEKRIKSSHFSCAFFEFLETLFIYYHAEICFRRLYRLNISNILFILCKPLYTRSAYMQGHTVPKNLNCRGGRLQCLRNFNTSEK